MKNLAPHRFLRGLYYQFSLPHCYISLSKVGRMYFFRLGVKGRLSRHVCPVVINWWPQDPGKVVRRVSTELWFLHDNDHSRLISIRQFSFTCLQWPRLRKEIDPAMLNEDILVYSSLILMFTDFPSLDANQPFIWTTQIAFESASN